MKKYVKGAIATLLLAIVPVLAWAGLSSAQRFSNSIDKGEVVQSSLYSTGKTVTVKGEIFGDVFCAGQKLQVDAIVHGDVLCAGQDITIAGKVDGDIRAAGQTVSVSAEVGKSVTLAGSDVSLDADAKVGQDLSVAGSKANIKGAVGRDVSSSSGALILNGKVGRNVQVSSNNITLKSGANVAGDFTYTSTQKLKKDGGATVAGETTQKVPERRGYRFDLKFYLFAVIGVILAAVALAAAFPRFLQRTTDHIRKSLLKSLVVGILGSLAALAVMAGLGVLLVGIPLAILLFVAVLLGALLSLPITAYCVGRFVFKDNAQPMLTGALGAFIVVTLYFLPWIGLLVLLVVFWLGFGSLLLELKEHVGGASVPAAPVNSAKKSKKA